MLLLTLRGTPTCYYGDELGLPSADFGSGNVTVIDPQGLGGPSWNRLVARTPMQWSTAPHGGFSEVRPWLPLATEDPRLTVERQQDDPASVLHLVRSLIHLRREVPALAVGSFASIPSPSDVFSFGRQHPEGSVEIHLNFGEAPREVNLPGARTILMSTAGGRPSAAGESGHLTLRGREGLILGVRSSGGFSPGQSG
jgi:alpha-glucosidase